MICICLRIIPELVAFPYPIGYDVVNYYIPVISNFEDHWSTVVNQFPLYTIILYGLYLMTGLSAHSIVVGTAVILFGIFGISIYYIGRRALKLDVIQGVFLVSFVIVQMTALRTAWDLHRDIFALTAMMFLFSLLVKRETGWKTIALIFTLTALTVAADRMIGALLCISIVSFALIKHRKDVLIISLFAIALFFTLMTLSNYGINSSSNDIQVPLGNATTFYEPQNLLILFLVSNGLIGAPAIFGFLCMKNIILKIPLLASVIFSFSWLIFPGTSLFVADRWIILSGIFLSIFAGYCILHIVKNIRLPFSMLYAIPILAAFVTIGLAYATMPYDNPFILYGVARAHLEHFSPVTMQFNSLDTKDNDKMLSAIELINQNTEEDAIIVGDKHWRGFMELYLKGDRVYRFSNSPEILAEALDKRAEHVYLVRFDNNSKAKFTIEKL